MSLTFAGREAMKYHHHGQICALLRSTLDDDITISAGQLHVYMYAGTAAAAEGTEHAALQALAELGLTEDCRLERWESASQEWRDVRSGLPTADETDRRTTLLGAAAGKVATNLAGAVVEGIIQGN
ncbi:MAG TPA: hypothetical protein VLM11_13715 [Streptosporangiaceae bacterium]|nr:hypothetical protein [Streptosporangiaceae bacterium]